MTIYADPMADRIVSASDFKARCLALLDRVAETGERIVVTKRGRAVAVLGPLEQKRSTSSPGGVTILTDDEDELFSTGERWNADS